MKAGPMSASKGGTKIGMPAASMGTIDAKAMPFSAYMQNRAAGKPGTGSNSSKILRDRAARLRAKAHARSAAHELS